jgi:hypothetical protein
MRFLDEARRHILVAVARLYGNREIHPVNIEITPFRNQIIERIALAAWHDDLLIINERPAERIVFQNLAFIPYNSYNDGGIIPNFPIQGRNTARAQLDYKDQIRAFVPSFSRAVDAEPVLKTRKIQSFEQVLRCFESKKILTNPVTLSDGYAYNRNVVAQVLARKVSPITGQWLNPKVQYSNKKLKEFMEWYLNVKNEPKRAAKPDFDCTITMEELSDPVILSSGFTVDKSAAKQNAENQLKKCPFTRKDLELNLQVEDKTLKQIIKMWNNHTAKKERSMQI